MSVAKLVVFHLGLSVSALSTLACASSAETARSPAVAFAAPAEPSFAPCVASGPLDVTDTPASVVAGIALDDERDPMHLVFTTTKGESRVVKLSDTPRGSGPASVVAQSGATVAIAWDEADANGARIVRTATQTQRGWRDGIVIASGSEDALLPSIVPRPGGFLLVWMEGTIERGYVVRARALGVDGAAVGPAISLSDSTLAPLGPTRAVVRADGTGAVAYFASTGRAFQLVTAKVVCSVL